MRNKAILHAVLAALRYCIGIPLSKLLLDGLSPYVMASALYLGAGIECLSYVRQKASLRDSEKPA